MHQTFQTENQIQLANRAISRFTIILLGAVLMGMGMGRGLAGELADMCGMIGLVSVACYVSLEFVAWNRDRQRAYALQHAAEVRLSQQKQRQRLERFCRGPEPSSQYRAAQLRLNTAAVCSL